MNAREEIIVCRCMDISQEEVETLIDAGCTDSEELKRFLHIGMGPCQGRTCGRLVTRILAQRTGRPSTAVSQPRQRPPLTTIPIRDFLGTEDD